MGVGQSSSLRSNGNFNVSSLSKKLNSNTLLFPNVSKDVQTKAFKHNSGITDLLAKLGPQDTAPDEQALPVQDANTITIDVSSVGEQKNIDMSQTISIEIVSRGNDSFDSILKVIDEDGSERVIDDGLQSKTEDELNTMLEKNNKARTPLAVEINLLKSEIDEMRIQNQKYGDKFNLPEEFTRKK